MNALRVSTLNKSQLNTSFLFLHYDNMGIEHYTFPLTGFLACSFVCLFLFYSPEL